MARRSSALGLLLLLLFCRVSVAQDWQSLMKRGWDSYSSANYQEAIQSFEKSNRVKDNFGAHKGLAFCAYELGMYDEAANQLRLSIALADNDLERTQLKRRLAYSQMANGQQSEATRALNEIGEGNDIGIELWPQDTGTGFRISRCYRYSSSLAAGLETDDVLAKVNGVAVGGGRLPDVLEQLRKQKAGSKIKVLVYRDGTPVETQISVGSTADLSRRMAQWKDEAKSLYEKGNRRYGAKDYSGAVEDYKKALELEETFAPMYFNLAMSQVAIGQKEEAASNLEAYLQLRPQAPNAEETRSTLKSLGGSRAGRKKTQVPDQIAIASTSPTPPTSSPKTTKVAPPSAAPTPSLPAGGDPSGRMLAVLPWRFVGTADNYSLLLSGDLSQAILNTKSFSSVFSVYDSQYSSSDRVNRKELDDSRERIWPGTSSYSRSHSFNAAAACELGRKLGAEAVLIGYWEVGGSGNDIDSYLLELHLIDVGTGKVISAKDQTRTSIYMGSFKPYMRAMVQKLVGQYRGN